MDFLVPLFCGGAPLPNGQIPGAEKLRTSDRWVRECQNDIQNKGRCSTNRNSIVVKHETCKLISDFQTKMMEWLFLWPFPWSKVLLQIKFAQTIFLNVHFIEVRSPFFKVWNPCGYKVWMAALRQIVVVFNQTDFWKQQMLKVVHQRFLFQVVVSTVFLFSPRSLAKMHPFWLMFFRWVETTNLQTVHPSAFWALKGFRVKLGPGLSVMEEEKSEGVMEKTGGCTFSHFSHFYSIKNITSDHSDCRFFHCHINIQQERLFLGRNRVEPRGWHSWNSIPQKKRITGIYAPHPPSNCGIQFQV